MATLKYKAQVHQMRENAIISAGHRLLATKGYDLMTVDEVAAEAGIAKASLYKHFTSKEELAGAAMVRLLESTLAVVARCKLQVAANDLERLKAVARWAMLEQLSGQMPSLPTQNSALSLSLQANKVYMDRLIELSEQLGAWITNAQSAGLLDPSLPPELVLYTLFACACNPVLGAMKAAQIHTDEQIVDWMERATFGGLQAPTAVT
jgi:AcrR family transcriptional regulator